jgi:hypothetical protein
LSPERIVAALSPGRFAYAAVSAGVAPSIQTKGVLELEAPPGAPPWQPCVAALADLAQDMGRKAVRLTVVLSNHFVRYALVPQSAELKGGEEALAYARHCFARVHGERSKSWEVRLSSGDAGPLRMASAIDLPLFEALRAASAARAQARLRSIQPYLMSAFNHWRAAAARGPVWLLLAEPQRACLAHLHDGRWDAVQAARGDYDEPGQWADLLDRERHRAPANAGTEVLVHAPQRPEADTLAEIGPWRFRSLALRAPRGYMPVEDSPLAMALCAL